MLEAALIFTGIAGLIVLIWLLVRKAGLIFAVDRNAAGEDGTGRRYPVPDKSRLARRATCLGALVLRGSFESGLRSDCTPDERRMYADSITRLENWLSAKRLLTGLRPEEINLISREAGNWGQADIAAVMGETETLGCLCWALSLARSIPPYDSRFDAKKLLPFLHLMEDNFNIQSAATLRSLDSLLGARSQAQHWDWRATMQDKINRAQKPPPGFKYDQVISFAAKAGYDNGHNDEPLSGDFPAFGKAYRDLTADEFALARNTASARLRSLDWLCGYAPEMSAVKVED